MVDVSALEGGESVVRCLLLLPLCVFILIFDGVFVSFNSDSLRLFLPCDGLQCVI